MQARGTFVLASLVACTAVLAQYTADWASIDSRPMPAWYDGAKIGIFIHWGVFSVPSWGTTGGAAGEWYWWNLEGAKDPAYIEFHNKAFGPTFQYAEFAPKFTAELFDPKQWAEILKGSGAKYVVFTSKHHDGYTNYPTPESWNWNSVDVGPHIDINKELSTAIRDAGLIFGNYYSLFEWFHPLYLEDKANGFKTSRYVDEVMMPQIKRLVTEYEPDIVWTDGDWEATADYWRSTEFLAWLFNESKQKDRVVVNDRWGNGCTLNHGGVYIGPDRYSPGKLQEHKWEDAFTIDTTTWGFKRNSDLSEYMTPVEILNTIFNTVAFGGNVLINIGPTHDGRIVPIFQERLRQMGNYLKINGEAIYETVPWTVAQNQSDINAYYTAKGDNLFVLMSPWPKTANIVLQAPVPSAPTATVSLFTSNGEVKLPVKVLESGVQVTLPSFLEIQDSVDPYGLALKLEGFGSKGQQTAEM